MHALTGPLLVLQKYNLTRHIPEPVVWGRPELMTLIEHTLSKGPSMEVALQIYDFLVTQANSGGRTGSFTASSRVWIPLGKVRSRSSPCLALSSPCLQYMTEGDNIIRRLPGKGNFQRSILIKHLKVSDPSPRSLRHVDSIPDDYSVATATRSTVSRKSP